MTVNTIVELNALLDKVDQDAQVLAAITNDDADSTDNGPAPGYVTTRLGSNVKNIQKVIADVEADLVEGLQPSVKKDGATIVESAASFNYQGGNITVENVDGEATITVLTRYHDLETMLLSEEGSRGVGTIWEAGAFMYEEVSANPHHTTAAGIMLQELGPNFTSRDRIIDALDRGVTWSNGTLISADGFLYKAVDSADDIPDMPGLVPVGTELSPRQFGGYYNGVDNDSTAVRLCYFYANTHQIPVTFAGIEKCALWADGQIIINVDTHGHGCQLVAINGINTPPTFSSINVMFKIEDENTPVVSGVVDTPLVDGNLVADLTAGSTRPTADFLRHTGYAYIQGSGGTGPEIADRYKETTWSYRQSFAVQPNGRTMQPLSLDLTTESEFFYEYRLMSARGRVHVQGFTAETESFNNQTLFGIYRNGVTLSDMQFTQVDGSQDPDSTNKIIHVERAAYIHIDRITAQAQPDGDNQGGTYLINMSQFAEVYITGVNAIEGWGCMGTNHGNGLYISDSNINRMDAHNGGHNYYITDSTFYNRGAHLGWGGGVWSVTNCHLINTSAVVGRPDYGNYFFGTIRVTDCTISDVSFTTTIVALDSPGAGTNVLSYPVAHSIVIENITRTDNDGNGNNRAIIPLSLTVNTDAGILAPIAPSNIKISNITCSGNWRLILPIDYQNMLLPPDTDFCSLTLSNVKPTRVNTTGLGVNIPANTIAGAGDYKVDFHAENCTKLSINAAEHAKMDFYLRNCDLNRVSVADGAVVEIDGGLLTDMDLQDAETHVPVGAARIGSGYTTIRNVKVQGEDASSGWDLSNVETMIGVDIPDNSENEGNMLPTGCLKAHAYYGWRRDDPSGEITPDFWGKNTNPGVTDMTEAIEDAIVYASDNNITLKFKSIYGFTNISPTVWGDGVYLDFDSGAKLQQLSTRDPDTPALQLNGLHVASGRSLTASAYSGDMTVSVDNAANFEEGRLVFLRSNRLLEGDHRFIPANAIGQLCKVASVSGNDVTFVDPLIWDMIIGTVTSGTAQAATSDNITLDAATTATTNDIKNLFVTILSGTGAGQSRYIVDYDETTKIADIGTSYGDFPQDPWDVIPDATSVYEIVEDVTVDCYAPYKFKGNIKLEGYPENNVNVAGVNISYADTPILDNAHIDGCSNYSLYTRFSYLPVVRNCQFKRANYAYNNGSGLGYGHSDYGSYKALVENCIAIGCRTGFDATSASYGMTRRNNTTIGGGPTYDGGFFYPDVSSGYEPNSGFSSHCGAIDLYDTGNDSHNVFQSKIRGIHTIDNCRISGFSYRGYLVFFSPKAIIMNSTYTDSYTYTPIVTDSVFDPGDDGIMFTESYPSTPQEFIHVQQSDMPDNASLVVRNNVVSAVQADFIRLGDLSTTSNLSLEVTNNHVTIVKGSGSGDQSLIDANDAFSLGALIAHNNVINWGGDAAGSVAYDNLSPLPFINTYLEPSDMVMVLGEGMYAVRLATSKRANISYGNNRQGFFCTAYQADDLASHHWYGLVDSTAGVVNEISTTGSVFHPADTALSAGSTTSGMLNLSIRSNGTLQVYNKTGATQTFIVELGNRI